jgi:hypothetical protein
MGMTIETSGGPARAAATGLAMLFPRTFPFDFRFFAALVVAFSAFAMRAGIPVSGIAGKRFF